MEVLVVGTRKKKQESWQRKFSSCQNVICMLYKCVKPHCFYFVQNPVRLNSSVQSPCRAALSLLCSVAPYLGLPCYVTPPPPLLLWMSIFELEGGQKRSLVGWLVGRLEVVSAVCQKPAWWMQVVPIHRSDVGGGLKEDRNSDSYHRPSSPPCVWSSHGWLCLLRTIAEDEQICW